MRATRQRGSYGGALGPWSRFLRAANAAWRPCDREAHAYRARAGLPREGGPPGVSGQHAAARRTEVSETPAFGAVAAHSRNAERAAHPEVDRPFSPDAAGSAVERLVVRPQGGRLRILQRRLGRLLALQVRLDRVRQVLLDRLAGGRRSVALPARQDLVEHVDRVVEARVAARLDVLRPDLLISRGLTGEEARVDRTRGLLDRLGTRCAGRHPGRGARRVEHERAGRV